jgi:ribonucleotide reductase beta subunit family protein with ferritin-like domain
VLLWLSSRINKEGKMSVFDTANKADHTKVTAFLDPTGGPTIQRYDTLKYKSFDKLTESQLGFFWRPEEVDIYQDAKDTNSISLPQT